MPQIRRSPIGERQGRLLLVAFVLGAQMLARTGDGEPFLIKKFFYAQDILNIFVSIHALPGAALDRLELWKLSFPETQDIGWQTA